MDERPADCSGSGAPRIRRFAAATWPGSRLGRRIIGVARFVEKRPLGVTKARARERDLRSRLGRGPRPGRRASRAPGGCRGFRCRGRPPTRSGVRSMSREARPWGQVPAARRCPRASLPAVLGAHQGSAGRAGAAGGRDEGDAGPPLASKPAADRGERRRDHVLLHRRVRVGGQPIALRRLGQQEERAETAGELVLGLVAGAVQVCALDAALVQFGDPARGELDQLFMGPELDRVGRAGLRAGRLEPVLETVVAERALAGPPILGVAVDHAERTGRHAVAAAVADVRLEDDGLVLGADQRARGARVEAARVGAVLADIGHEHPLAHLADRVGDVDDAGGGLRYVDDVDRPSGGDRRQLTPRPGLQRSLRLFPELRRGLEQLDEPNVTPGRGRETPRVVVRGALAGPRAVRR